MAEHINVAEQHAKEVSSGERFEFGKNWSAFLTVLDARRSYYFAQQAMVVTKLNAAKNLVAIYQAIGGDASLQATPVCQPLPGEQAAAAAPVAPQCAP